MAVGIGVRGFRMGAGSARLRIRWNQMPARTPLWQPRYPCGGAFIGRKERMQRRPATVTSVPFCPSLNAADCRRAAPHLLETARVLGADESEAGQERALGKVELAKPKNKKVQRE